MTYVGILAHNPIMTWSRKPKCWKSSMSQHFYYVYKCRDVKVFQHFEFYDIVIFAISRKMSLKRDFLNGTDFGTYSTYVIFAHITEPPPPLGWYCANNKPYIIIWKDEISSLYEREVGNRHGNFLCTWKVEAKGWKHRVSPANIRCWKKHLILWGNSRLFFFDDCRDNEEAQEENITGRTFYRTRIIY